MSDKPKLLAPAGSLEKLKYAIQFGADACYGSGPAFSMRTQEIDFPYSDLKKGIDWAHKKGKEFYLTLNIYPHEKQFKKLPRYIKKMKKLQPDAFILADPGVLKLAKKHAPKIELHLSTQANALNSQAIKFWHKQGIKQVIIARETTYKELELIKKQLPKSVELELFIHGAMCIAYSGRCLLSSFFTGYEANQGQCKQPCRWGYQLIDKYGKELILKENKQPERELKISKDRHGTYLLNSKTLCLIDELEKLKKLELSSYKIEGRNKSTYYLATVVRAYKKVLDAIYSAKSKQTKKEIVEMGKKELDKTTNRGFIKGFLPGKQGSLKGQEHLTSRPQSNWQFAARLIKKDKPYNLFYAHNQIKADEKLELITPDKIISLKPKFFLLINKGSNKKKVKTVNTNDKFYLKTKKSLPNYTLVRKKKKG